MFRNSADAQDQARSCRAVRLPHRIKSLRTFPDNLSIPVNLPNPMGGNPPILACLIHSGMAGAVGGGARVQVIGGPFSGAAHRDDRAEIKKARGEEPQAEGEVNGLIPAAESFWQCRR